MQIVSEKEYEGAKIFIAQHYVLFQYWFWFEGNMYMQWSHHWPKWYRWFFPLVGKPAFDKEDTEAVVQAHYENAVRSIDMMLDPDAEHCVHNVVIAGKRAALCPVCGNNPAK